MTTANLKFMPYAQAHVKIDFMGSIYLVSYTTTVAHISNTGWLTIFGLYSKTTRRHISAFLKEYTNSRISYQTAKQCYEDGYCINIYTGEVRTPDEC